MQVTGTASDARRQTSLKHSRIPGREKPRLGRRSRQRGAASARRPGDSAAAPRRAPFWVSRQHPPPASDRWHAKSISVMGPVVAQGALDVPGQAQGRSRSNGRRTVSRNARRNWSPDHGRSLSLLGCPSAVLKGPFISAARAAEARRPRRSRSRRSVRSAGRAPWLLAADAQNKHAGLRRPIPRGVLTGPFDPHTFRWLHLQIGQLKTVGFFRRIAAEPFP